MSNSNTVSKVLLATAPGLYAGVKAAEYVKENPEKAKQVAKTAAKMAFFPLYGVGKAGAVVADKIKENPEKAKQIAKVAAFPMYGVGKAGAVVADKIKENPEAVKQALKYTVFGVIPLIADMIKN